MPNQIQVLDPHVADLIAAGEGKYCELAVSDNICDIIQFHTETCIRLI